jgi:hypothetical protein
MTEVLARDLAAIDTMVRSAANGDAVAFAQLVAEHHSSMARVSGFGRRSPRRRGLHRSE